LKNKYIYFVTKSGDKYLGREFPELEDGIIFRNPIKFDDCLPAFKSIKYTKELSIECFKRIRNVIKYKDIYIVRVK